MLDEAYRSAIAGECPVDSASPTKGNRSAEMDESLVGSPGFKPVREALKLSWVGSIPTRLRHFPAPGQGFPAVPV